MHLTDGLVVHCKSEERERMREERRRKSENEGWKRRARR
jgi:hypothetical protein